MDNNVISEDMITFQQEKITKVSYIKWFKIISDEKNWPIVGSLLDAPKTLDEIVEIYPKGEKVLSKSSINRLVKQLIDEEIIIEVGRRLKGNWTTSKKIYASKGIFLVPEELDLNLWNSEKGLKVAEVIAHFLSNYYKKTTTEFSKLRDLIIELLTNFTNINVKIINKLLLGKKENDFLFENRLEANQLIHSFCGNDAVIFFRLLGWLGYLVNSDDLTGFSAELMKLFNYVNNGTKDSLEYKSSSSNKPEVINSLEPLKGDVITAKQNPVLFISSKLYTKCFTDINYATIRYILDNSRPLTIDEIFEQFHQKTIEYYNDNWSHYATTNHTYTHPTEKPKSFNTVYKYVKDLMDDEFSLVMEAGRRIIPGSHLTKILYTTRAKKIITFETIDEFWELESWSNITQSLGHALEQFLQKSLINYEKFQKIVTKIEKDRLESFKKAITDAEDSNLVSQIFDYGYDGLNAIIRFLGFSVWILKMDNPLTAKKEILQCFK